MRNYEYISNTKINMLFDQLHASPDSEETTEFGASVSLPMANLSSKISSKAVSNVTIFDKIDLIKMEVEHQNLSGTIIQDNTFIIDDCTMAFSYGNGLAMWRGSFFDRSKRTLYRFLLYGSQHHLTMYPLYDQNGYSSGDISGSSISEFYHGLIEAGKCALNQDDELTDLINNTFVNDEFDYIHDLNLEKWQIVEWFFYDRGLWTNFAPYMPLECFARVDFRQTITRDYYEKSNKKNEKVWKQLCRNGRWVMPDQVEQIVYVYASPIYVARKSHPKYKIRNINNRSYLYIPEKELYKICLYTPSNLRLLNKIIDMLSEGGLIEEAELMKKEMGYHDPYYDEEIEKLTESEIMQIIRHYVTSSELY